MYVDSAWMDTQAEWADVAGNTSTDAEWNWCDSGRHLLMATERDFHNLCLQHFVMGNMSMSDIRRSELIRDMRMEPRPEYNWAMQEMIRRGSNA